ncbi:MAG: DNRLRE domain-containing protein [Candidatus Fermentibacteraceae bacterium]|nr:DNRLRE domain-containing protein [Candidatus Fermentibacteraceae bacterium]MBN2609341.1 DNRLRE domain-containing protein [Candidatus Fermentibacteraceae bacterium]
MKKFFFVACLVLFSASYLNADSATLNPVADSPLFELQPSTNYGSQNYGYWGYYNGGQRTLLLYDLSGISGVVTGAQLSWQYYSTNFTGTANMLACVVTGGSWDEYSVTWTSQPAHDDSPAGRLLDIPWDTGSGIVTHDCTAEAIAIIQGWVDNPSSNYGMLLKKTPESGNTPRCYPYMRESSSQPVQLTVEYETMALESMTFGEIKALFR